MASSASSRVVKNPPANAGDTGRFRFNPWLGRSPGGGNDNPLQYSCLENPMDRRAWWAIVYGVARSQTQLNNWACPLKNQHSYYPEGTQDLPGVSEAVSQWQGCKFVYINNMSSFFCFIHHNAGLGIASSFENCLSSFRALGAIYYPCLSLRHSSIHPTSSL